jgi:hypothetical protein
MAQYKLYNLVVARNGAGLEGAAANSAAGEIRI